VNLAGWGVVNIDPGRQFACIDAVRLNYIFILNVYMIWQDRCRLKALSGQQVVPIPFSGPGKIVVSNQKTRIFSKKKQSRVDPAF